ncbi:uncharacterized protein [Rutidosis leptorrhynchoides]|uniref:uncharacterized protein n=1 Tax=Rutidosis leptorrhynchoides TaxID=125765 RepID=UPI003A9A0CFB
MGTTWRHIIQAGKRIDTMGVDFTGSFYKLIGEGAGTSFWHEDWTGHGSLKNQFGRLYALEVNKEATVMDQLQFVDGNRNFSWVWSRYPRGRSMGELNALISLLSSLQPSGKSLDEWLWKGSNDGRFTTKILATLVDQQKLTSHPSVTETIVNKAIPQKVNIFIWRSLLQRIPVRVELDKRGMDLDSVLCPLCNAETESVSHALLHCDEVYKVWKGIDSWWNMDIDTSSVNAALSTIPSSINYAMGKTIWQATMWVVTYSIWNARNKKVFSNASWNHANILNEVQLKSFQWISKRLKKSNLEWSQWLINPGYYVTHPNKQGIG